MQKLIAKLASEIGRVKWHFRIVSISLVSPKVAKEVKPLTLLHAFSREIFETIFVKKSF